MKRGEIYYADLGKVVGSEQGGNRPVLIIQNNIGNRYSPTTIVAIITSRNTKAKLPTHYWIEQWCECGLKTPSMVEFEQIKTLDKQRFGEYVGELDEYEMKKIKRHINISLGLGD